MNAPIELATHVNPGKHTERQSISKDLIIIALFVEQIAKHVQRSRNHDTVIATGLDSSNKNHRRRMTLGVR